mgnify:FL=1
MADLKVKGAHMATGYWGRDGATHIAALQSAERVLALNRDKLYAMGLPFRMWERVVHPTSSDMIQCSCFKDTTQQSDSPCLSCYGQRWQPGYLRFGHKTIFRSSTHQDLTLINVELNKVVTPFRLQLKAGFYNGRIITPQFTVTETNYGKWEYHVDAHTRDIDTNNVTVEFSLSDPDQWFDGSLLGTTGYNPSIGDIIQFRITLSREVLTSASPIFEMFRARYPTIQSPRTRSPLPADAGDILLLKTWDVEKFHRELGGAQVQNEGLRYWTLPLSFFDNRLDRDAPESTITQDHFVEEPNGPEAGTRYVATKQSYSRTFKIFTRQEFNLRRVIGESNSKVLGETIARVW